MGRRFCRSKSIRKAILSLTLGIALISAIAAEARFHKRSLGDDLAEQAKDAISANFVREPQDLETCFSPDERCDLKLLKFVSSARKSLEIAIYDINLGPLVSLIIEKSKQIPVRMLVDRGQARGEHSAVERLVGAGVDVRFGHQRGSGIMHNKFVIVDGRMIETGSFNQTHHASFYNNENQLYIAHPKVVQSYHRRFETIWGEGRPAR